MKKDGNRIKMNEHEIKIKKINKRKYVIMYNVERIGNKMEFDKKFK